MKRDTSNVFPEWLAAMNGGNYFFAGGEIVQTRQHSGRGSSRVEFAVEAAGNALLLRDAAARRPCFDLVGGYSDEAGMFYAFDYTAKNLFDPDFVRGMFVDDGTGWREQVKARTVRLYGEQHPVFQDGTKLNVLKLSNNGDLSKLDLQRGSVARWMYTGLIKREPRSAHAVASAYRDGGTEGFAGRLQDNAQWVRDLSVRFKGADDRLSLVRALAPLQSEELIEFFNLPLGLPEGDEILSEVVKVSEASIIY